MSAPSVKNLPLKGMRVLDLSRVLAGPYAAMTLADLGAEVTKVERPVVGDETRHWGPPFVDDVSAYFLCANRNKSSVTLDMTSTEGKKSLTKLVTASDVVIHNFTPDVAQKLKVDDNSLRSHNAKLIISCISGFGRGNSFENRGGYDFLMQAMSGLMAITGPINGESHKLGVAITDVLTALYSVIGILAAWSERLKIGDQTDEHAPPRTVDVSLLECAVASLVNVGQSFLVTGQESKRYGNAHPSIVPYQTFPTKDAPVAIAVGNDEQFSKFCAAIGLSSLSIDEKFKTNEQRVIHRESLAMQITAKTQTMNAALLISNLESAGVPVAPVQTVSEVYASTWAKERGIVAKDEHGISYAASPLKSSFEMSEKVRSAKFPLK
jgi:crotonobetainyl-CoA:carnitine CoA-transferase CaiB-like acyl-CoA transferase